MPDFDRSVFVNCPFDARYHPILRAILFSIVCAGLIPRLATERADGGESRLAKIVELIRASRFSIHDLSRCQSEGGGEVARFNMPFELGVDHGVRTGGGAGMAAKRFLVLDEKPFRLKQALSDINGWDPHAHDGDPVRALKVVRNWLVQEAGCPLPGGDVLFGRLLQFEEWKYDRPDHSRRDVDSYEHFELIEAMRQWRDESR